MRTILKTDWWNAQNMASNSGDRVGMDVWCTLIPPDKLGRFAGREEDLRNINQAYEDWLTSMRSKSIVGADAGVLLDRVRILMINIGIACALNRNAAEEAQSIISEYLRDRALRIVAELKEDTFQDVAVKQTLKSFFENVRFTRDIFPEEEIGRVIPSKVPAGGEGGVIGKIRRSKKTVDVVDAQQRSIQESTNILKRLYMRLLSPDPWGNY